jgi:hypothetical protein
VKASARFIGFSLAREFKRMQEVMRPALVRLAREGGAVALVPLWEQIAGGQIARQVRPVALEGTTLILEATTPRWRSEIAVLERELLAKLESSLGAGAITRLSVRVSGR